MLQTLYRAPLRTVTMPCEPLFKLFIACEDNAAFFQARKVEDQVRVLCGDEIKVSRVFWSFSLLRHSELRSHAVKEATEAQLIIISLSESDDLPGHVKSLMESLPHRSISGQTAIVALVQHEESLFVEPPPVLPYLQQLAGSRGMDFFCNKSGWDRLDFSKPVFQHSHAPVRAMTPADINSYHIPWNAGGINE